MCNNIPKTQNNDLYKRKYYIAFYDNNDEFIVIMFNNIKQICQYKNRELTQINITLTHVELYRALKRKDNSTRMLDGSLMHVHLMNAEE